MLHIFFFLLWLRFSELLPSGRSNLHPLSVVLPMSSSSDVIDLERRVMAGGVSLLVCCGAAKGSQPNVDFMFRVLVYTGSHHWRPHFNRHSDECKRAVSSVVISETHSQGKCNSYLSSEQCPQVQGYGQPSQLSPWDCCHPDESCWPPADDQPLQHSVRSPDRHNKQQMSWCLSMGHETFLT